jgi:hypothetical protein
MKSKENENTGKNNKNKTTWGNVEPGERTEHEGSLQAAEDNAAKDDCKNVSSTNMDPEPGEGEGSDHEEGNQDWQQLNKKEQSRADNRKGGYPKN